MKDKKIIYIILMIILLIVFLVVSLFVDVSDYKNIFNSALFITLIVLFVGFLFYRLK